MHLLYTFHWFKVIFTLVWNQSCADTCIMCSLPLSQCKFGTWSLWHRTVNIYWKLAHLPLFAADGKKCLFFFCMWISGLCSLERSFVGQRFWRQLIAIQIVDCCWCLKIAFLKIGWRGTWFPLYFLIDKTNTKSYFLEDRKHQTTSKEFFAQSSESFQQQPDPTAASSKFSQGHSALKF